MFGKRIGTRCTYLASVPCAPTSRKIAKATKKTPQAAAAKCLVRFVMGRLSRRSGSPLQSLADIRLDDVDDVVLAGFAGARIVLAVIGDVVRQHADAQE